MEDPVGPLQAASHPDPYPAYRRWREANAMRFDEAAEAWVVLGAREVEAVLAHPALRVRPPSEPVPRALGGTPLGELFANLVRMNNGAFHASHRPIVERRAAAFADDAVATATRRAVEDLAARRSLDALLSEVPVQAMARLLGVPGAGLDEAVRHVHAFTAAIAPGASAPVLEAGQAAARALLAEGESHGLALPAIANRVAFMQQSLDATAGLVGNALVRVQAAGEPGDGDWAAFVAEVARWDPAVHLTRRFAAEDAPILGHAVRAGDGLIVMLAAAARDPACHAEPDRFLPGRKEPLAPVFGTGPHACPGERIALAIAAAAVPALLAHAGVRAQLKAPAGYRPLPNARIPVFGSS